MVKNLNKKSLMLGLASVTFLGVVCVVAVLKQKDQVDKNFGEYQEEAYPIGTQIEREQSTK